MCCMSSGHPRCSCIQSHSITALRITFKIKEGSSTSFEIATYFILSFRTYMYSSIESLLAGARLAHEVVAERINLYKGPSHAGGAKCLAKQFGPGQVPDGVPDNSITKCLPLTVEDGELVDVQGRRVVLKGINVDAAMKLPVKPFMPSYLGDASKADDLFYDGDNVSFVGRPFPLEEAEEHFRRIKSWGFNTIRYLVTWEALEHEGPGKYDEEFVDYTIEVLRIIHRVGGLYVFFDCHQDVWSRFCGGSGSPMWTLFAAGLQPKRISVTGASVLHSDGQFDEKLRSESSCYPKMLWTSNYKRLALFTMFTLFFAGEAYFPNLKINGTNIQHYLQEHHFNALSYLWLAVVKRLPLLLANGTILGFELLNEPNQGLVGHPNLDKIPDCQHLRIGTTPTVFDCLKLGVGLPVEVDVYKIAITGPQKCGRQIMDPKGARVWLSAQEMMDCDEHYGWKRSGWLPDTCIYSQIGIWNYNDERMALLDTTSQERRLAFASNECQLLKPTFFNDSPKRFKGCYRQDQDYDVVDTNFFVNVCFVNFYLGFKKMIRALAPDAFVLIQPLVLVIPPNLRDDPRGIIDKKTIYCPHYYDGMSLMFKTWNYRFNVDTLGIMRDRYSNPLFGIVLGETAIRNCIKKQFCDITKEGKNMLGDIPVLMSETGMPFDMNNKRSYNNGRFRCQTSALDALANALEGSDMHHTYWCYASINGHKWGDHWNNEDFSFWSSDDRDVAALCDTQDLLKKVEALSFKTSSTFSRESYGGSRISPSSRQLVKNRLLYHKKRFLSSIFCPTDLIETQESESDASSFCSDDATETTSMISNHGPRRMKEHYKSFYASPDGVRAVNAVIRPYIMTSPGVRKNSNFDIKETVFELTVGFDFQQASVAQTRPTIIFLPKWHYPILTYNNVDVTNGFVQLDSENEQLHWFLDMSSERHEPNTVVEHTIIIRRHRLQKRSDPPIICGGQ